MTQTSYRYPVARASRERFGSRYDYIGKRVTARNPELCQVMQQAADALRKGARRPVGQRSSWKGFPWLTMVFGSGALELHDQQEFAANAFADAVEQLIKDDKDTPPWGDSDEDPAPSTSARDFALALVKNRMGDAKGRTDGQLLRPQVEPVAAKLVYAAHLLTRFFHSVRAEMGEPTSRWEDDDVARLTTGPGPAVPPDPAGLAVLASGLIWDIIDLLGGTDPDQAPDPNPSTKAPSPVQRSVSLLLKEINDGLEATGRRPERHLRSYHLRLITEVAWYFLTLGTPIYPGWTDLLLTLMLREAPRPDRSFRSARPRYPDLRELPQLVAGIYEPATKTSWETTMKRLQSEGGGVSPADWSDIADDKGRTRTPLYWAAAEVLWAQAKACRSIPAGPDQLPPAVAFVTSFDLELDMALLATARGRTFRVALPVHQIHQVDEESAQAELCWLIADVVPGSDSPDPADLAALRHPVNWRLLTSEFDPAGLRDCPIVIHLSGCPLFTLPEPGKGGGDQAIRSMLDGMAGAPARDAAADGDAPHAFAHAVTVDEYLALRQSEAELIWSSWNSPNPGSRANRALPQDLMVNGLDNPRFWISMGVPVGDAAIRHRLISQLSRQRIVAQGSPDRASGRAGGMLGNDIEVYGQAGAAPEAEAEDPPSVDGAGAVGVAVNTRIGDDETSLLYWVGFDVVQADCNGFIHDLRHYVRHLAESGPNKQPSLTMQCPLAGGRD